MMYTLGLLVALLVGSALGAAWRRAETRRAWRGARHWQGMAAMHKRWADAYEKLYRLASRQAHERLMSRLPDHELPLSCQLGSRSAVSERIEGAVRALSVEDVMRGEP